MTPSPDQLRAARALLRIEQEDLARRAAVSVATIRRLEIPEGEGRVASATLRAVQQALEQAGAEFIIQGVRRRQQPRPDADTLYRDLQAISRESAGLLAEHAILTDRDLYGEDGLPA
jgi:transcriptional regulator with XRE-family HTH domain